MRLAFLCCLLTLSAAAQTLRQAASDISGTCVFGSNVLSGSVIIVSSSWETSTNTPTVTDTRSTTYAQVTLNTANNVKLSTYVGTTGSSGANTITFAVTGSGFQNTDCSEWTGNITATVDIAPAATTFSGTPATITTGTATTTKNGDLLYAHVGGFRSGGKFSVNSLNTFTVAGTTGQDSSGVEYSLATTNGNYTLSWAQIINDVGTMEIIGFKSVSSLTVSAPSALPDGANGVAYSYTLPALGGSGAYTWATTSGSLQNGLTLASNGLISGTPTSESSNTITFQVTDGAAATATKSVTLKIGHAANTIAKLQSANGTASPVAFGSNVASGSYVTVELEFQFQVLASKDTLPFLIDTRGTAYSFLGSADFPNTQYRFALYGGVTPSGGADSVTISNFPGAGFNVIITEFSNVQNFLDAVIAANGTGGATITSGSLTTLVANSLVYSAAQAFTTGATLTINAPFTSIASGVTWLNEGYNVVAAVGANTSSYGQASNTDGRWSILNVALRPTTTSPTTGLHPRGQVY